MTKLGLFALLVCVPATAFAQAAGDQPAPPAPPSQTPSEPPVPPTTPSTTTPPTMTVTTPPTMTVTTPPLPSVTDPLDGEDADAADPADTRDGKKPKSKKGNLRVTYTPGHWVKLHLGHHTALRMRLLLEPMLRFSQAFLPDGAVAPDATVDLIVRRARLGFHADLKKHVAFRFEISVKNMHFEIHNMFATWEPNKHLELQFGFIKAPGGLERDTFSFDQPFIERSVMTFYNYDHEVGVMASGTSTDDRVFWAAAVVRDPPPLPGGDPEDSPQIPSGVEKEDLARAGSKWNASGRLGYTPGHAFEASIGAGTRLRLDEPDYGEIAVEPYDSTYLTNRPYRGVMWRVSGDVAVSQPHWKMTAEAGFRRDGKQLAYPDGTVASEVTLDGHLSSESASVVFGFTPDGEYGPATDAAPLLKGWELVTRLQGARIKPVDQGAATLVMGELGAHWQVTPQVRLQTDFAVEKFGKNDNTFLNENKGGTRLYAQTWAVFRL